MLQNKALRMLPYLSLADKYNKEWFHVAKQVLRTLPSFAFCKTQQGMI